MSAASTGRPTLRFGEFEIQPGTGRLLRNGRRVRIEPRAFELLALLARERGRLVEKDEILAVVWSGAAVTDNALTRAVARVRRALGDAAREPRFVETVHARGYRFLAEVEVVEPGAPAPAAGSRASSRGWRWVAASLGLVLAAAALAVSLAARRPGPAGSAMPAAGALDPSRVAVLPLENLGRAADDDYLVEGLTEQITSTLAQIRDLRVIAGTTTRAYGNNGARIREIAAELRSGTVLEGSARRAGDRVRIHVQLIDGGSEEHLWSGEFDRSLEDLFVIQSEIATRVAEALRLSIPSARVAAIRRGPTRDFGAYELYLKGREAYRRRTRVGNEEAIEFYRAALEIDPDFALAEAGLANAFATRAIWYGHGPEADEDAVRSAERALRLNPELPEAYKALGIVAMHQDRFRDAIELNRRALELNPSYDEAYYNLSSALHMAGRWDEALLVQIRETTLSASRQGLAAQALYLGLVEEGRVLAERALAEVPFSPYLTMTLALEDARAGDLEAARRRLSALRNARPDWSGVWQVSGQVEALAGDYALAAEYFEEADRVPTGGDFESAIDLARGAWLTGDLDGAERHCARAEAVILPAVEGGSEYWLHYWGMAVIEAIRGRSDAAVDWYARAVDVGYRYAWPDEVLPEFELLRGNPRFLAQLERMRGLVAEMREAVRPEVEAAVARLIGA